MRLTKEQKFLYTRIAILVASVGWLAFAFAGLKGFPFWYGGFVLCFWLAFGLLNYSEHTTLWLLAHKRIPFLLFYGAIALSFFLLDRMALDAHLWFYPLYHGWLWAVGYLVWYPAAAFSVLELFYFLARACGERLVFRHRKKTVWHDALDWGEGGFFLLMSGMIVLGAISAISLFWLFVVSFAWFLLANGKLMFHIAHAKHLALILLATGALAAFLNEVPNTGALEWVYLVAPLLNTLFLGVPLWMVLGWYWFTLFTLRLWLFLVLHPRVK
jgi:hypothetical protein